MRFFKWLGPTYLIPWVSKTEEALDVNGDISSLSGLPPHKYKTYYYGFYWLGGIGGFHAAIIDITEDDHKGKLLEKPCPNCDGQLYGNLLGEQWCITCTYDVNLYNEGEE